MLAVVLFHAGVPWLPGGFLGVDAFFVLSGFLITRLLIEERDSTGQVSLGAFWARRVRRLAPALLLLVVCVVLVAELTGAAQGGSALRLDALSALG